LTLPTYFAHPSFAYKQALRHAVVHINKLVAWIGLNFVGHYDATQRAARQTDQAAHRSPLFTSRQAVGFYKTVALLCFSRDSKKLGCRRGTARRSFPVCERSQPPICPARLDAYHQVVLLFFFIYDKWRLID